MRDKTEGGSAGRQPRPPTLPKSADYIVPVSTNPRLRVVCRSGERLSAESWEQSHEEAQARPNAGRPHRKRAIVDAGPDEQAMSWYYYLEGKIRFPFQAKCLAANAISPLRKGEGVEVIRLAPEDACEHDMLVQIKWQGRKMAVPLSQLAAVDPDESTSEAIGDWHYWVAQGNCL